jgi:hypothetical protein
MNECTVQERSAVNEQRLTMLEAKVDAHIKNTVSPVSIIGALVLCGAAMFVLVKGLVWAVDNGHA